MIIFEKTLIAPHRYASWVTSSFLIILYLYDFFAQRQEIVAREHLNVISRGSKAKMTVAMSFSSEAVLIQTRFVSLWGGQQL